jgi:hypothetical protein
VADRGASKSIPQVTTELWELSVAYARQETIDPLKGLGRFLSFGVGGSLLYGIGSSMLLLALLRGLQTHAEVFDGNLSWVPYLIIVAAGVLLVALLVWRVVKRKGPGL